MEKITSLINDLVLKIDNLVGPIWDKFVALLEKGTYTIYACVGLLLAIIVLVGLINCFKKPKLFITFIILLGIIGTISYFFVYK